MTKQELKQRFRAGQYPTEEDFIALIDMMLSPTSEIPPKNVIGLLSALQGKYNREQGESLEASIKDLKNNLTVETTRAQNAESALQKNIDAEKSRAEQAETSLSVSIENMANACFETFATKEQLTAENKRATEVEQTLQKNITAETTRAQNAETALQGEVDSLKIGSINTMQEGAQVVTDATSGKFGLLLTSRAGNIDNWRQRLITFTGIIERRWDRTIGNMGGNWSPIWNTVLEWDKITTFGSDVSNNTLTLTGSNMADDTTAIIMQQATVYNNTLIL